MKQVCRRTSTASTRRSTTSSDACVFVPIWAARASVRRVVAITFVAASVFLIASWLLSHIRNKRALVAASRETATRRQRLADAGVRPLRVWFRHDSGEWALIGE